MSRFLKSTSVIVPTPDAVRVDVIVQLSQMLLGTFVLTKSRATQVAEGLGVLVRVTVGGVPVNVGVDVPHPVLLAKRRPQPLRVPSSIGQQSLTVSTHLPSAFCPSKADNGLAGW